EPVGLAGHGDAPPSGSSTNAPRGLVYSLAWVDEGQQLVTGGEDGTVRLWDIAKRTSTVLGGAAPGTRHGVGLDGVVVDGTTVLSGGDDRFVRVWDIRSPGKTIDEVQLPFNGLEANRVQSLGVLGGGKVLIGTSDGAIYEWKRGASSADPW